MSRIIKSEEAVIEDYHISLYRETESGPEEEEELRTSSNEEEYRKKYELISKEKKQILDHARIQAKQTASKILEDAYAQRDKIVNTAETESERMKHQAMEEGFAAGMRESFKFVNDSLQGLNEEIDKIKEQIRKNEELLGEEILEMSYNMAEKILKKHLDEDKLALLELAQSVIREEKDKSQLVVYVSSSAFLLAEALEEKIESLSEQNGASVKVKQIQMEQDGLRIETSEGIVDASVSVQLKNLRRFLSEYERK